MGLRPGPVLQPGEDAVVALDDPVLLDGVGLDLGGGDGHAEADLQNATSCRTEHNDAMRKLSGGLRGGVYSTCPCRALMCIATLLVSNFSPTDQRDHRQFFDSVGCGGEASWE